MLQKLTKNLPLNIPAILLCLSAVLIFSFFTKADSGAKIQFTLDTIISLTGITDGDLYIAQNSECDSLSVSGSTLTIGDIPAGSDFILKTSSHNNALKIIPSGGVLNLTFDSGNLSSGNITQWTLTASAGVTAAHIVGVSLANTWYAIKMDNVLFNSFQSNSSGEVSFTYNGGFSSKVFTIEQDTTAPTEFSLVSPINNATTSNSKPTFSWNASTDPDLSYYQLYIDSSLDTDNISNSATSITPTNSLSCGAHTWYVKAKDNAGNSTSSDTFNLTMSCGGGLPSTAYNPPAVPKATAENPQGGFNVSINDNISETNTRTVTLKFNAGSDVKRMAISNTPDFKNASQIPYQETIEWDLKEGSIVAEPCGTQNAGLANVVPQLCGDYGTITVYAKFYTQYGVASETVSDSIVLKTATAENQPETSNQGEAKPETKSDKNPESKENIIAEDNKLPLTTFTQTLQLGSRNNQVIALQDKLKELKFFPENIESNGNFGPTTKQAVMEYQKSKGIYPNGIVGPRTRKALNGEEFITNKDYQFTQDLKYNDKNEEVKQLQTRLRDQNFFPYNIPSTGWFGPITQTAVNIFQKFYNIVQNGIVDEKAREVLNR